MSPVLSVQKTFLHFQEQVSAQPVLRRSQTVGGYDACRVSWPDGQSDGELEDQGSWSKDAKVPTLSRETTFDEFEVPCTLGFGGSRSASPSRLPNSSSSLGEFSASSDDEEATMTRQNTYDDFDAPCTVGFPNSSVIQPIIRATQLLCASAVGVTAEAPPTVSTVSSGSINPDVVFATPTLFNILPATMSLTDSSHVQNLPALEQSRLQQLQPETVTQMNQAELTSFHAANGNVMIQWCADSRRFTGRSEAAVSPAITVEVPGGGSATFKLIVRATGTSQARNFRASNGMGVVELKCECLPSDETYTIKLDRSQGVPLGVDLESRRNSDWSVKHIRDGLVDRWNETQPRCAVNVGDAIVSVNGISGDLNAVKDECKKLTILDMTLRTSTRRMPAFDVSFAVGDISTMRGPTRHDFAERTCCSLNGEAQVWDIGAACVKRTRKVIIMCEIGACNFFV